MHPWHPRHLGDPQAVGLGQILHHGGEERRRQIERIQRQLVERPTPPVPQGELRRISLVAQGRAVPQRVHLGSGGGGGRAQHLLPEAFQQRHCERIGFHTQPRHVPLGHLDLAADLGAPGHQRGRAARDQRDAADRGPAGRGKTDQHQRRGPQEGVPVRPPSPRAPDQHPDDRGGQRDRHTQPYAPGRSYRGLRAAEKRGGGDDQGRGGHQNGELPGEPESDRDARRRGRDPSTQTADEVGRGEQQRPAEGDAVPPAGKPASPEPDGRDREQRSAQPEHPGGARERTQERPEEGPRREEGLESECRSDGSSNREPESGGEEQKALQRRRRPGQPQDQREQYQPGDPAAAALEDPLLRRPLLRRDRAGAEEQPIAGRGRLGVIEDINAVRRGSRRIDAQADLGPLPEQLGQAAGSVGNGRVGPDQHPGDRGAAVLRVAPRLEHHVISSRPGTDRVTHGAGG